VLEMTTYPWNCDYYKETGRMMPKDGLEQLARHDAIFLGALGNPALVPDHIALRESLLLWRQAFDLYINLRPVKVLPGIPGPLKERPGLNVDMVFIRENSEGEYAGKIGRASCREGDRSRVWSGHNKRNVSRQYMRHYVDLVLSLMQ